jgi:splicing factor 3A subunit 1
MAILQLGKAEDLSPPPPLEFSLGHPTGINAIDIDVIKLTAQYTAVNGREFLGGLAQREQKNPQFDFLKPTHVLFSYFTSLVDSYAKILQPSNDLIARLQQQCIKKQVLQQALQRWQFTRSQEDRKKKESAEADEERLAFQAVDWQDFTVVETVDFPEDELFDVDLSRLTIPPLQHQLQIQQQLQLQQQQQQLQLQQQMELAARRSSIEANLPPPPPPSFKGPSASNLMPPPPPGTVLAPRAESSSFSSSSSFEMHPDEVAELQDQDIKVVANYQPRISGSSSMQSSTAMMMVDPLSGKAIPVGQMEEHMRVQLLDPKWREEQKRFADKQRETGFAEGGSIADSLRMFAKKRGDIFGQAAGGSAPHSAAAIAEEAARERKKQEVLPLSLFLLFLLLHHLSCRRRASHSGTDTRAPSRWW